MAEKREKKPKKVPITKLHPGTEELAKVMGWTVEVVRLVADLPGCPRVRGGKGKRFTSTEAFKAWFASLAPDMQRSVPQIDGLHRLKLAEEVSALTWCNEEGAAQRLANRHTYEELVKMRDHWRDREDEEQGEKAAAKVLERRQA